MDPKYGHPPHRVTLVFP